MGVHYGSWKQDYNVSISIVFLVHHNSQYTFNEKVVRILAFIVYATDVTSSLYVNVNIKNIFIENYTQHKNITILTIF